MRRKISFYLSKSSEVHSAYCLSVFTRRRSEVSRLIVLVEVDATEVNYSLKTKKTNLGSVITDKKENDFSNTRRFNKSSISHGMPFQSNGYQINTSVQKGRWEKVHGNYSWLLSRDAIGNKTTQTKVLNASARLRVKF